MSSRRLPGKVLLELAGRAILDLVHTSAATVVTKNRVIVATSEDAADDPIAEHCLRNGIRIFRGPLENVAARLQGAVREMNCEAFFRICADSPFYDHRLMLEAIEIYGRTGADLVTNVFPRSYPKGRSVELAKTSTFLALNTESLSAEEQEHVFTHYYKNSANFRIENFRSERDFSSVNLCIDTQADFDRVEEFVMSYGESSFGLKPGDLEDHFGANA
jgi:spore coat polysaccharide biosynthesis protein SpsF